MLLLCSSGVKQTQVLVNKGKVLEKLLLLFLAQLP